MKKKNNVGLIIAAAAFILLLGAAAFLVGKIFIMTPERKLQLSAAKMLSELSQYGSSFSEEIDFAAIDELRKTGTIHTNTDVSITIPESEIGNLSFSVDAVTNISEKRAKYDIGAGVYGFDVSLGELTATQDTLYLSVPLLFEDTYSLVLTNLGERFNNSQWASLLETELPEDCSIELFGTDSSDSAADALIADLRQSSAELRENIVYENIKEKKDGHTGVRAVLDKESVNHYMERLRSDILESEFYEDYTKQLLDSAGSESKEALDELIEDITAVRFQTDYVLDFYFDKKGRIVNISTPDDIQVQDGGAVAIDINFLGTERVMDIIDGGIYAKSGEKISYIGIKRDAEVSDALYNERLELLLQTDSHDEDITFSYKNDIDKEAMSFDMELEAKAPDSAIHFTADGEFTDIVQGESYTLRLNNSSLAVDGEEVCYASAVVEVEPSDEEIDIPEASVDLLEMDMTEIQAMIYEAIGSIRKFDYE